VETLNSSALESQATLAHPDGARPMLNHYADDAKVKDANEPTSSRQLATTPAWALMCIVFFADYISGPRSLISLSSCG